MWASFGGTLTVTGRSRLIMWLTFAFMLSALFGREVKANTYTAASCSQTDVQNAINSTSSGDTVVVPGTCSVSWSSAVSIPSTKGITVEATGTVTLTNYGFSLSQNTTSTSRISGFTFTSPGNNGTAYAIVTNGTPTSAPFRIDHNTFVNSALSVFVGLQGNAPGLLDHNTFNGGGASEEIHNLGMGPSGNAGWTDNIMPGSANMVIIEDNTFETSDTTYICSGIESYYGARNALRHNTFKFCQVDQHGTAGAVGARWWEVYDNNFIVPNGQNQCCFITMRGGSGVIWGNTTSGTNTGAGSIDLYEEDTGTWPLAYQVGSGINGDTNGHNSCGSANSAPAYLWGNGSMSVGSQTTSVVELSRDYFSSSSQPSSMNWEEQPGDTCSTTYTYTPYTYPDPLTLSSGTPPSPPTSLAAVVQ
jgi:hypothetical protein